MNILLADGSGDYLLTLEEMILHGCGFNGTDDNRHFEKVTTADRTVTQLTGNTFDICFLGDDFADGTYVDILRHVEQLELRTAFIVLSRQGDKASAFTALTLGAKDYLIKSKLDAFGVAKSAAFSLFHKSKEMELRGAALHDPLTGLGNGTLFRELGGKLLQQAKRARDNVAIVFMDVDGFKPVNDLYGHHVGDQLLRQIAGRLLERAREGDIVARLGGDEFVVLLGRIDTAHQSLIRVTGDLANAISQKAFHIDDHDIRVGISYGTSLFPDDSENIEDLLRLADRRMYLAKANNYKNQPSAPMIWLNR